MPYFLLTGATGLLGRYLLRDLSLADVPLAVVVRPTRWESAKQRIETAMACWENELGRALLRPVVLEGDISEPCLGFDEQAANWVAQNCSAMIHSAASLTFHADEPSGEPWRSNLQGTRNVIDLCRQAGIRRLHHVSTAYVCGLRRGTILESELNLGQQLGNDYERTKLAAETEVLAAAEFDQVTVYRPSIIVGDSRTGYTTSYHGFYTPLRVVYSLLQSVPWEKILQGDWLAQLQLAGDERKNLVSVEWVSAAMTWLITHPDLHGQTYHLTNPKPATAFSMQQAFAEVLGEVVRDKPPARAGIAASDDFVAAFREQMTVYQSYWSDDPQFDSSRTQAALAHLPCPEIDREVMDRLIRFAIGKNFGWPREAPIPAPYDATSKFARWLTADESSTANDAKRGNEKQSREKSAHDENKCVNLHISGPGGGPWHLLFDGHRLLGAGIGLHELAAATCYMTSATFAAIVQGDSNTDDAMRAGRLVCIGSAVQPYELRRLFHDLTSCNETMTCGKTLVG